MLEKFQSKKNALLISNIAGMVSGALLGIAGICLVLRFLKSRKSIKGRAKRAFKTIENKIAV